MYGFSIEGFAFLQGCGDFIASIYFEQPIEICQQTPCNDSFNNIILMLFHINSIYRCIPKQLLGKGEMMAIYFLR